MKNKFIRPLILFTPGEGDIRDYSHHLYPQNNCAPGRDRDNWLEATACLQANIPSHRSGTRLHQYLNGPRRGGFSLLSTKARILASWRRLAAALAPPPGNPNYRLFMLQNTKELYGNKLTASDGDTLRCLRRVVPAAVPGVVFLSGGQTDVAATERLNAICQMRGAPWQLTFSFGRALQDAAMKTWQGLPANAAAAQAALLHRARCNGLAVQGKYSAEAERADRSPSTT